MFSAALKITKYHLNDESTLAVYDEKDYDKHGDGDNDHKDDDDKCDGDDDDKGDDDVVGPQARWTFDVSDSLQKEEEQEQQLSLPRGIS